MLLRDVTKTMGWLRGIASRIIGVGCCDTLTMAPSSMSRERPFDERWGGGGGGGWVDFHPKKVFFVF